MKTTHIIIISLSHSRSFDMHRDVNTKFAEFLSSRHLRKGVLILSFWNEYDLRHMISKKVDNSMSFTYGKCQLDYLTIEKRIIYYFVFADTRAFEKLPCTMIEIGKSSRSCIRRLSLSMVLLNLRHQEKGQAHRNI